MNAMRVLVTGATGFIGRALVPVLQREGHQVLAWVRSETAARGRLGAEVELVNAAAGVAALTEALERSDAVVNLAGEPIMGGRWTAARRQVLRSSRIGVTHEIVQALAAARQRPRVLVSGSAVGYYGDRGNDVLTEDSPPGEDFLAQLCQGWEAAARQARGHGLRVVLLRTGVVLGRDGGALASMLPPFKLGVGGPVGHGRQFLPWIHLHDLVGIIAQALVDDRFEGAINGVAPAPVTSRDFGRALGSALHRPAILPTPALALRAIFGEAAAVLLGSQRVDPAALRRLQYSFAFPALDAALADVLGGPSVEVRGLSGTLDAHGSEAGQRYLNARRPVYELRTETLVEAPVEKTFLFFSQAQNLGMLTPSAMRFSIAGPVPAIDENTTIEYRLRVGRLPITWRTRIVGWRPGAGFVDFQERGPYRSWWHEHAFRQRGTSTLMEDRVCYAPPFGVLGRLANRLFIVPTLRRIFQYRADVIRLRFGGS
jgi:hypothetical protein